MTLIKGQNFSGTEIILDDNFFLECSFENCTFIYSGGPFKWEKCAFSGENNFDPKGAAQRVLKFLYFFRILREDQMPQPKPPSSGDVEESVKTKPPDVIQ
jgi:hypothetical protein